jgi:hypothetical protein
MNKPTYEELEKEVKALRGLNEMLAKRNLECSQALKLLVIAGYLTEEKIAEAQALLAK